MDTFFYLDSQNKQQGPISTSRFAENGITAQTLVWRDGMSNWTPAGQVPELRHLFNASKATDFASTANQSQPAPQQPASEANPYGQQGNYNQAQTGFNQPQGNYNQAQNGFNPYAQGNPQMMGQRPSNYLILSIFTTICCCLPFGIVGIIYANKVDSAFYAGDYIGAVNYSNTARTWNIVGILSGVLISIIAIFSESAILSSFMFL